MLPRIIPVLLLHNGGLYKTTRFKESNYIGDPLNAVRIFNKKEVDELVVLDFKATIENRKPDFKLLESIAARCFMPLGYGGGVNDLNDAKKIIYSGVEKIIVNTVAAENPGFVEKLASYFGSSSVIVSVDVKKNIFGNYEVFVRSGTKLVKMSPEEYVLQIQKCGAGEILLNSISDDGSMKGYDLELIRNISGLVKIPVIVCGGAGQLIHFKEAHESGATAMAAGSFFVFHGSHKGVLISYPSLKEINSLFS